LYGVNVVSTSMQKGRKGETGPRVRALAVNVAWVVVGLSLLLVAFPPVRAEAVRYTLEVPDHRAVTYEIPLEVLHAGKLTIGADWSGSRRLSLRVDRPGDMFALARRSGPSPIVLEIDATPELIGVANWKLTVHAIAARGGGEGLLTIDLPGAPAPKIARRLPVPRPPLLDPEPWMVPRRAPGGSPDGWTRLFDATESYRSLLEDEGGDSWTDHCRWQESLMRFLAERQDDLAEDGSLPAESTRRILRKIGESVLLVENMKRSDDPLMAGPPPQDPQRREVWFALRRERIEALESQLDETLEAIQRGHAPSLEEQSWPVRMITCLAACERHFEERVRLGEEQAVNRDLAQAQWDRLLAAAEALLALAELESHRGGSS
jgi:hypothetical protein